MVVLIHITVAIPEILCTWGSYYTGKPDAGYTGFMQIRPAINTNKKLVMVTNSKNIPRQLREIEAKTSDIGFNMASGRGLGSLLKVLAGTVKSGRLLEIGTGTGLSLAWMIDGMDTGSTLVSIDNDPGLTAIARSFHGHDERVELLCTDAAAWIKGYNGRKFDLVFADAWPGKYSELPEVLDLIGPGGIYLVDDLLEQPNWPSGHGKYVSGFLSYMESRTDFHYCFLNWETGILIATKKP